MAPRGPRLRVVLQLVLIAVVLYLWYLYLMSMSQAQFEKKIEEAFKRRRAAAESAIPPSGESAHNESPGNSTNR
ncbi:MAG: hypothetical protein ACREJQ_01765 [bacterium]